MSFYFFLSCIRNLPRKSWKYSTIFSLSLILPFVFNLFFNLFALTFLYCIKLECNFFTFHMEDLLSEHILFYLLVCVILLFVPIPHFNFYSFAVCLDIWHGIKGEWLIVIYFLQIGLAIFGLLFLQSKFQDQISWKILWFLSRIALNL